MRRKPQYFVFILLVCACPALPAAALGGQAPGPGTTTAPPWTFTG